MEASQEINFLALLLPLVGILFLIALGVVFMHQQFQKNIIRQQLEREELKGQHQKELLHNMVNVQEEERKRIARDLHDELGAVLSISKMQLVQLERQDKIEAKQLKSVRELIENTLSSTRRISHELMPLQLAKVGLEKSLLTLFDRAKQASNIKVELVMAESCQELSWLIEVALYRIYTELLNNTLKHAEAQAIEASILCESEWLFCRYSDDGKGLDPEQLRNGLGMKSIQNRVESFDGDLEYGNRNEGGFFAKIKIPLATTKINT